MSRIMAGILASGDRTCSKAMGFARAQPILRAFFAQSRKAVVGWVERSDTHHVTGILANGYRTCSKMMGFAELNPSYGLRLDKKCCAIYTFEIERRMFRLLLKRMLDIILILNLLKSRQFQMKKASSRR
jgi:hypothetical protein